MKPIKVSSKILLINGLVQNVNAIYVLIQAKYLKWYLTRPRIWSVNSEKIYILCYVLFYKFINFKTRINKDDYFVLFLLFISSLALFQCFVIPPVLYLSAPLFRTVSIVPGLFRCSGGVQLFRFCSVVQWVFRVLCSGGVPLFRLSAGVPSFRVPVFLVL